MRQERATVARNFADLSIVREVLQAGIPTTLTFLAEGTKI